MFKSYTHQRFFAEVSNREHREIFQINAPPNQPPLAPPTAPPVGPNVPPNNPNAAKDAAKNRILQAQAAGQKVQTMKQSMDTAIAAIKNVHTPPAAPPAGAPAAPDALTAAKSSVDALKSATNINTLPADPLNTMLTNARLLGPEAVIVCDKIDEAMIAADTAINQEADLTKKADITAMKVTLETNAKLVLADLLTPDVKTGAPKAAASFLGPLDPTVAKDIEAAANGDTALLSAINDPNATEANRSKAIGQMMSKYGVTVEKNNAGNYAPVAPASSLVKFLNQVSGLFMMLGLGNIMQQKKSASTPSGAPPNAPPNGPATPLNQVEQDAIKKNVKDPAIGMTKEKTDAGTRKTVAEDLLNGSALVPVGLNQKMINLNTEKARLESEIQILKTEIANNPAMAPADKTARENLITTKTTRLTAIPAEIKTTQDEKQKQEDVVKKENEKIKYIDDLVKAATDSVTALKEVQTYITTFNTKAPYKNADSQVVTDAFLNVQIVGPGDDLGIRIQNVDMNKWQAMQNLAAQTFGIVKTDMDLTLPDIMKDPEKCLAALKVIKEKFVDHEKKIDSRIGVLTAVGLNQTDAQEVAKIESSVPSVKFEYKNATLSVAGEPKEDAFRAWLKTSGSGTSSSKALMDYMDRIIKADPESTTSQFFLLKNAEHTSANLDTADIKQMVEIAKTIPLLKDNLDFTHDLPKDTPGMVQEIKEHPLVKGGKLTAHLKAYWGI